MSDDPIGLFRIELRGAAARRASAYQRRRRVVVALAVALAAVFIVGGAIAAQTRWLSTFSMQRYRAEAAQQYVDSLERGYTGCMAARGLHRRNLAIKWGGWVPQGNAAKVAACKTILDVLSASCFRVEPMSLRVIHEGSYLRSVGGAGRCKSVARFLARAHRG